MPRTDWNRPVGAGFSGIAQAGGDKDDVKRGQGERELVNYFGLDDVMHRTAGDRGRYPPG